MFSKISLVALCLSSFVIAGPVASRNSLKRTNDNISFNNWHNIASLNGFDNFYGEGNFNDFNNQQIIIVQEQEQVCSSTDIVIIQQRLSVIMEFAKRILLQSICEVETQTIVLQQFSSSISNFQGSLSRQSGKSVGYDSNIASMLGQLVNSDGSLNSNNLGFLGSDIGKNTVSVGGSNWNDQSSPASVGEALQSALQASQLSGTPSFNQPAAPPSAAPATASSSKPSAAVSSSQPSAAASSSAPPAPPSAPARK